MKKLFLIAAIAAALSPTTTWADEWTDPNTNVVYTYTPGSGTASVKEGTYSKAGSPNAKGDIAILDKITVRGSEYAVTSIGSFAFCNCSGLTSVTIPSSVTSIENNAFRGCSGLSSVTIPNSVTNFGNLAFYECSGLTSVTIPNSVTSIGEAAFGHCSGLTSVTIPNSVTSIGDAAFQYCLGLTSITIPNTMTSIGDYVFSGCSSLTSVTIPNSVTSIGSGAFSDSGLTSVTIPESVTTIGSRAFQYCLRLTSITIPISVTSIGERAFSECEDIWGEFDGLTEIKVDEGNPVYDSRDNCNAIIETESGTLIAGCKSTVIPNSVKSIGNSAFFDCTGLKSVTIPYSVTSIGGSAFFGCSRLTSVTIPNSVTSIGEYAFYSSRLTSITIPESVTSIGEYAFGLCSDLTEVRSKVAEPFVIDGSVFENYNIPLYVPVGTKEKYEATDGWKRFKTIIEVEYDDPVVEVPGDLNGDQSVDVGDIMSVINFMAGLGGDMSASQADVNGDGSVDVGDVMYIINLMAQ